MPHSLCSSVRVQQADESDYGHVIRRGEGDPLVPVPLTTGDLDNTAGRCDGVAVQVVGGIADQLQFGGGEGTIRVSVKGAKLGLQGDVVACCQTDFGSVEERANGVPGIRTVVVSLVGFRRLWFEVTVRSERGS